MKELTLQELKDLQLDILLKVDKFCREKGIRYYIGYGTLIGAVRHGGYIPWDDDIDIGMPRPDYERFIKEFNGTYSELTFICPELKWDFYAPYGNVFDNRTVLLEPQLNHHYKDLGVKIDVFPIDGAPIQMDDYLGLRKTLTLLNRYRAYKVANLRYWFNEHRNLFVKLLVYRLVLSIIPLRLIQKRIHKKATQYDFETSRFVDKLTFPNRGADCHWKRIVYEEYMDISFEGKIVMTLKDYDSHLKGIYGNYMQLPPEEERIPHHGFTAYWK